MRTEFGWAYRTPTIPEPRCRWCSRRNIPVRGCVVCVVCDVVPAWPVDDGPA
jgi:hypothetical protein